MAQFKIKKNDPGRRLHPCKMTVVSIHALRHIIIIMPIFHHVLSGCVGADNAIYFALVAFQIIVTSPKK